MVNELLRLRALAGLAHPVRRALHRFVSEQAGPVSREEAAAALGVPKATAAFHLDRLVADGLLDAEYRRLSGRTGPGAGRPAKLYRRGGGELSVTVPERDYRFAAELLAEALCADTPGTEALHRAARARGRDLARSAGRGTGLLRVLEAAGYQPREDGGDVELGNCPFRALAERHQDLVCGMNLAVLTGVADAVPEAGLRARPAAAGGRCCVRLSSTAWAGTG